MKNNKNRKRNVIIKVIVGIFVMLAGCVVYLFIKVPLKPISMRDSGYCVIAGGDIQLTYFRESDEIVRQKDGYLLRNQPVNPAYPCVCNEGAYLYLFGSPQDAITDNYEILTLPQGTYVSDSSMFGSVAGDNKLFFLKLSGGMFMNLIPINLQIRTQSVLIEPYSFLRIEEKKLTVMSGQTGQLMTNVYYVEESDAMTINDTTYFAAGFLSGIATMDVSRFSVVEDSVLTFEDSLVQFDMGREYVYPANSVFYTLVDGIYIEANGVRQKIGLTPLFYRADGLLHGCRLPSDYAVVSPKNMRMVKLPALSHVYEKSGYTMAQFEDRTYELMDCFLYDGEDTYLFLREVVLRIGSKDVVLPAMSTVTVDGNGTTEVMDYKQGKLITYAAKGYESICKLDEVWKINMSDDSVWKDDEILLLLGHEPEQLPVYQ